MKIHRLMGVVLVSRGLCAALPAVAAPALITPDAALLGGVDSDDDDDDHKGDDGDGDGDDGDDGGDDGSEPIER